MDWPTEGGRGDKLKKPNQEHYPLAGPLQKAQQRVLKPGEKLTGLFIVRGHYYANDPKPIDTPDF